MVTESDKRFISFENCFNFRDLGGYAGLHNRPLRWGRLFRSMTPTYMTEADIARARELNIGLVIDLRGDRYDTSGPISDPPTQRIAVGPVFLRNLEELPEEVMAFMASPPEDALPRLLSVYGPAFADAVAAMCDDLNTNVLFHCRLGKDRTGVFAALLLKLTRVSDMDIVEDYMLTERAEAEMKRLLASVEDSVESREPRVAREPVDRRAIECVLERLESQYGTAYNYFLRHGVAPDRLNALIESLLAPASDAASVPFRSTLPLAALSHN
jgi:protein-tyrosine phosphatase